VRRYDGLNNPIGKSYTRSEFLGMFRRAGFETDKLWRYYFPLRALGRAGALLKPLHRAMSGGLGLMIVVSARKPAR